MRTCALCARPSVRSYFHALYVSSFLIKKGRSGFEIPYYSRYRVPHRLGGGDGWLRSRISFTWTVSLRSFILESLNISQHRKLRWLFKSRGSFLHELLPGAIRPNINANSPHWFTCSFPKELEFDKRSKHDVIILLILITFSLDCRYWQWRRKIGVDYSLGLNGLNAKRVRIWKGKNKQKQLTKTRESTAERVRPARTSPANIDTSSLRTVSALSLEKESPYIFSKFKLLIQTLYMALSVSVLTGLTVIEKEVSLIAKAISPWRHSGEDAVNKQTISP